MTIREIRAALQLTQKEFAKRIGASQRSVRVWERGNVLPSQLALTRLRAVARTAGLTKRTRGPIAVRVYDSEKMRRYEGRPKDAGINWPRASVLTRNSFHAQRARYARLKADIAAGRVFAQPVVSLLDSADDIDMS